MMRNRAPLCVLALLICCPGRAMGQVPQAPEPGIGVTVGPVDIGLRGYFRAPLRLAWRGRDGVQPGESSYNVRSPWLVDDDYFRSGFAYTRIQESDWAEIYFTIKNKYLSAEVALMGSLFSDWARPLLDRQWGISQGYLTFHWNAEGRRLRFRMHVRAGAFWDRLGWLENYDTYLFARTHQMGGQVRLEFAFSKLKIFLLQGVGAHLEALEINQGLTLLNYLHTGVAYQDMLQFGFYFLDAAARDRRQLQEQSDADMRVLGLDGELRTAYTGRLYLGASLVTAQQANYLSPAIEVLHAFGGRGLTENFLGTEKSEAGTGALWNLAVETHHSLRAILDRSAPHRGRWLRGGDVSLRLFGLVTYVQSRQIDLDPLINRDARLYFKWGTEAAWQALPWLAASLRYDRVILDVQDEQSAFRIITPRITLTANWLLGAQIYLQYSRYFYGERVRLRPGQVALETRPDEDVFKLQAQLTF
ncbi:MAG: hypothetical protein RMK29_07365 [Myxococcales bacterium]|nr:hypothetical protein [Myxococcales bacterium]